MLNNKTSVSNKIIVTQLQYKIMPNFCISFQQVHTRTLTKTKPKQKYDQQSSILMWDMSPKLEGSEIRWGNNIINFQYHLDNLSGEQDLLLLSNQSFKDILLPHVISVNIIAINTKVRIIILKAELRLVPSRTEK